MASFTSAFSDEQTQRDYTRNVEPDYRNKQMGLHYAIFTYTFAGTEADTDDITLGYLGVPGAKVVPELSRVRDTGGAEDVDVDVKLNALVGGATSTDLSGTVSIDNASVAFTEIAASALVELGATDDLRLIIDDAVLGAVTAGETIDVEIAYYAPRSL